MSTNKCSHCNKTFETNHGLKIHIALKHKKPFTCSTCGEMYATFHGLQVHKGMRHKSKDKISKKRRLQLQKASKKYNSSEKGKKRQKKFEKSLKAKARKNRYKKSWKGKATARENAAAKRQRQKQEQEKERRKKLQEKDKELWRWSDVRIQCSEDFYERGQWIAFQRKRWKEKYGIDDYYDGINEEARWRKQHPTKWNKMKLTKFVRVLIPWTLMFDFKTDIKDFQCLKAVQC